MSEKEEKLVVRKATLNLKRKYGRTKQINVVERDAFVEKSIIFDDVSIEPGARVRRAIVDKASRIQAGASLGYDREADKQRGCTISESGIVVVPKGADIGAV